MNKPKRRYSFYDIFIFKKTPKGYVDFTNFSFEDKFYLNPKAFHDFNSDSPYLVALWFGYQYLISPITIDELLLLAKIKDNSSFLNQFKSTVSVEMSNDIVALMCAKKIANYHYGYIALKSDMSSKKQNQICDTIVYEFMRKKSASGKRVYTSMLEKAFKIGR